MKKRQFIEFIRETLAPDLKESGRLGHRKDLLGITQILENPTISRVNGMSLSLFLKHIEETEKEVRREGYTCTADDYKTGLRLMRKELVESVKLKKIIDDIENLEAMVDEIWNELQQLKANLGVARLKILLLDYFLSHVQSFYFLYY